MAAIRAQSQGPYAPSHRSVVLTLDAAEARFPTWIAKCITQMLTVETTAQVRLALRLSLVALSSLDARRHPYPPCEEWPASMNWNSSVSTAHTTVIANSDLASILGTTRFIDELMSAGGEWSNHQLGPSLPGCALNTHLPGTLRHHR